MVEVPSAIFLFLPIIMTITAMITISICDRRFNKNKYRIVARKDTYAISYPQNIRLQERRFWGWKQIYQTDKFENAVDLREKLVKANK